MTLQELRDRLDEAMRRGWPAESTVTISKDGIRDDLIITDGPSTLYIPIKGAK